MKTLNSCSASIDSLECFEQLTDEQLLLLEKNKLEVSFKKGEIICKQGSFASHIMYLCYGLANVYKEEGSKKLILKVVPQGGLIGLTSIFEGNTVFVNTAKAYQDCTVRMFDMGIFRQILKENALFSEKITNILCENIVQTYSRFFCLQHKQSNGKMADILLCLSDRIFKENEFELDISRKELADLVGLSKEQTIRTLKLFKDDNLIEMNGKMVRVLDKEALRKISFSG